MRRRRTRGTWFPTIGTQLGETDATVNGRAFALACTASEITTIITPLTFDTPQEGDNLSEPSSTLADVVGSEYILQRIVGKCFIERQATLTGGVDDLQEAVLVGAGFFVARANDTSVGGGSTTPIGSATVAERRDNYSPLETDTVREPWIWRRTWILGTAGAQIPVQADVAGGGSIPFTVQQSNRAYPVSTALYGSVLDGPHIDSKVKRRVSQDNRLFFAVSATPFPLDSLITTALVVSGYLDYRLFGSLRKARNTSAF